ncbi:unnamed protein product [Symbiodinium necroappetens]|uniref:Uncharacterized protein n=1 Tax=Symbiodinium necroappetens TaxID=1628268 RepID=A0A812XS20_9DINO|nr:unnamed protein product [Symbiodinium necroappetens]
MLSNTNTILEDDADFCSGTGEVAWDKVEEEAEICFEEESDVPEEAEPAEPPSKRARSTPAVNGVDRVVSGAVEQDSEIFFEEESDMSDEADCTHAPPKRARFGQEINLPQRRSKESLVAEVVRALKDVPTPDLGVIQSCIQSLPSELRLFPRCISYCYFWMMDGRRRCGKSCKYLHSKLPQGSIAKCMVARSLGHFAIEDASKQVSNWVLCDVSSDLEEQRCFVLDGAKGATITSLQRPRDKVLSPNVDADAVKALQAKSLSVYSSSFTALAVALQAKVAFGCVYLDYMWPLNYFESTQREVQKSLLKQPDVAARSDRLAACHEYIAASLTDGIHDVELLVLDPGHSLLSRSGAVLAVTMVHSQKSTLPAQRARLERVLVEGAKLHQVSLDFMGYTKPSSRPVATYFYGWNLHSQLALLPNVSKKLKKHCFFNESYRLYSPQSGPKRRSRPFASRRRRKASRKKIKYKDMIDI